MQAGGKPGFTSHIKTDSCCWKSRAPALSAKKALKSSVMVRWPDSEVRAMSPYQPFVARFAIEQPWGADTYFQYLKTETANDEQFKPWPVEGQQRAALAVRRKLLYPVATVA